MQLATLCRPALNPVGQEYPFHRDGALTEGTHVVQFRARVAGTETVLESTSLAVELHCALRTADAGAAVDVAIAADVPVTADAGGLSDVGSAADIGTVADGGRGAGSCGCNIAGRHSESDPARRVAFAALFLAVAARARRRRR